MWMIDYSSIVNLFRTFCADYVVRGGGLSFAH
jgi:hypothetical protein